MANLSLDELEEKKTAETTRPVHNLIRRRWSPRSFADKPIGDEGMQTLFEAAGWAASSRNEQPWEYIYAHRSDDESYQKLLGCLNEGNRKWAKDAAVLVLSLARRHHSHNEKPNRHYLHDTGSANTTMLLQAASMDIYGHMMAGFQMDKTIEAFELPDDVEPCCFIALGYLGDPEQLEEPYRSRELKPRQRRPVEKFTRKL